MVARYTEFEIDKNKIVSITTDDGANIVSAVRLFLGDLFFYLKKKNI